MCSAGARCWWKHWTITGRARLKGLYALIGPTIFPVLIASITCFCLMFIAPQFIFSSKFTELEIFLAELEFY